MTLRARVCIVLAATALATFPSWQVAAGAQSDVIRTEALIGLARVERDAGRYQTAAELFRQASQLQTFDKSLLAEFFWTLIHAGEADAAAVGTRVLEMDPTQADVRGRLVQLAAASGDEARARTLAQEGSRLEPGQALWHRHVGESFLRNGMPAKAAAAFTRGVASPDATSADRAQRALALEAAGRHQTAWVAWADLDEDIWSGRSEWVESRFRTMASTLPPADAAGRLAAYLSDHGPNVELQAQLVEAWASAGRADLALGAVAPLLDGPTRSEWLRREAELAQSNGDLTRAVRALEELRQTERYRHDDGWRLASLVAELGDSERAHVLLVELATDARTLRARAAHGS